MTLQTIPKNIPSYSLTEVSNRPGTLIGARRVCSNDVRNVEQMFVPHRKDYYFFFLVKRGDSHHWVDFLRYQVQPHYLYFTLPHQVHLKEKSTPTDGLLIAFTEEFLTLCNDDTLKQLPILHNKGQKHAIALTADEEAALDNLFEQILAECNADETFRSDALAAYVKLFLVNLSRIYVKKFGGEAFTGNGNELFNSFKRMLDKRYNTLHLPVDYAGALHVTVGHLNSIAKTNTGQTITDLIQERIILEAKRSLFHTEQSIKEIGYSLGFEDAAYFNRFFKRRTGTTPVQFRQQNHEKYH
jgi:AraC family transcriptional activator of pobA